MWIGVMPMFMGMGMISMHVRFMLAPQWNGYAIGLTGPGAFEVTQIAAIGQTLHMVMVAGLG